MTCRKSAGGGGGVLRISDEKTLQLVQLYAEEDCLWNPNSMGYKNREIRVMAAEKIATILDLPNFSARHVMAKFKNLRNSYSQELKKIAASVALGDFEEYRPKVLWFETMDSFLRPYLNCSAATWLQRDERQTGKCNDEETFQPSPECLSTGSEDEGGAPASASAAARKRRRNSQASLDECSVWNSLNEVQAQLRTLLCRHEDHHATFGQHVASLMRSLPADRALALQPRLLLLITEELQPPLLAPPSPTTLHTSSIEIDESD